MSYLFNKSIYDKPHYHKNECNRHLRMTWHSKRTVGERYLFTSNENPNGKDSISNHNGKQSWYTRANVFHPVFQPLQQSMQAWEKFQNQQPIQY